MPSSLALETCPAAQHCSMSKSDAGAGDEVNGFEGLGKQWLGDMA